VATHGIGQPPLAIARIGRFSILEFPYPATNADFACHVDLPARSERVRVCVMHARPDACPSGLGNQAELLQHGHAVIEAALLRDQAILHAEHGDAGEAHLLP
jgi:hypothetical protein